MNAVRCPPADQPVTMTGPAMPCSRPCVEPVERRSQLVRDLRQARLRRKRVARQRRRPAVRQNTLGEAGECLLAAALPITAMNVHEARRLGVGGGIEIPLRPLSWSIGQIEVLRALLAESLSKLRPSSRSSGERNRGPHARHCCRPGCAPRATWSSSPFRRTPCPGLPPSRSKGRAFPTPLRQPRSPEPPVWNAPAWSTSFLPGHERCPAPA